MAAPFPGEIGLVPDLVGGDAARVARCDRPTPVAPVVKLPAGGGYIDGQFSVGRRVCGAHPIRRVAEAHDQLKAPGFDFCDQFIGAAKAVVAGMWLGVRPGEAMFDVTEDHQTHHVQAPAVEAVIPPE